MTNRIGERLRQNTREGRRNVLPFFTCGYPNLATTAELIQRADALGAAVVEIGVPFSDSIADGSVIQQSFNVALERGVRLSDVFKLVSDVRTSASCGLVAMVSHSIVCRHGIDRFMDHAAGAGLDGVIVPDLPLEESEQTAAAADRVGLCHIGLVAPTTSPARREAIARASRGFVYQIAVAGTTGARRGPPPGLAEAVAHVRAVCSLPVCVGFGISTPRHVRSVCRIADGAIIGSAIVRCIARCLGTGVAGEALLERTSEFLARLIDGPDRPEPK